MAPMTRPGSVTASAVVSLIGSGFTLLVAALMVFAAFTVTAQPQAQVPQVRGIALGFSAVAAALAGLGIATAVGLLRLRSWARTSIMVFAGFMAAICLLSGLVVAIAPIPAPPELPQKTAAIMRSVLVAVYGVPFLIGVWWLVLFNKQPIKDAFAAGVTPGQGSQRPLSISIIGWMYLLSGIGGLVVALTPMPAFIAGMVLKGWSARALYLVFGAASTYLGWGLLKLKEHARVLTLVWFALGGAHAVYMAFSPTARAGMREFSESMQPTPPTRTAPLDNAALMSVIMLFSLAGIAVAAWFLVRNKPAFQRPPASSAGM